MTGKCAVTDLCHRIRNNKSTFHPTAIEQQPCSICAVQDIRHMLAPAEYKVLKLYFFREGQARHIQTTAIPESERIDLC